MGVLLNKLNETQGREAGRPRRPNRSPHRMNTKPITKHAELPDEFIDWMNKFVDWEVESRIGYTTEEVLKSKECVRSVKLYIWIGNLRLFRLHLFS